MLLQCGKMKHELCPRTSKRLLARGQTAQAEHRLMNNEMIKRKRTENNAVRMFLMKRNDLVYVFNR